MTKTVNVMTRSEGRYLLAYLRYLAGFRRYRPAPSFYGVPLERARRLQAEARELADGMIGRFWEWTGPETAAR